MFICSPCVGTDFIIERIKITEKTEKKRVVGTEKSVAHN
jgi:hypothetical protein